MTVKAYAIVNGEKYYNRILIDESQIESYVYPEDPDAILIEDESGEYSLKETEGMKNYVPVPEDPFASLTLEQKLQIAAIIGLGNSNTELPQSEEDTSENTENTTT